MPRILVIGSTNTDMVTEVPKLPAAGETVLGGAFRITPGGKGANQAVAAARAGGQVVFITALGDDSFGQQSRERFAGEGIETRYIATKPGVPSGVALILVDSAGENLIAVAPGANGMLSPEDLPAEAFSNAAVVVLQLEIPMETVLQAARLAKDSGAIVLLNPAPMPLAGLPEELLRSVDVLTPNQGELLALVPGATGIEEAAASVLARGPKTLVVTRGRQGASAFTREESFQVPAVEVRAVDTVGAGDCFSACLAVAIAEKRPLREAVRFAAAAAGLSTTRPGAQAGMPTRAEIEAYL